VLDFQIKAEMRQHNSERAVRGCGGRCRTGYDIRSLGAAAKSLNTLATQGQAQAQAIATYSYWVTISLLFAPGQ